MEYMLKKNQEKYAYREEPQPENTATSDSQNIERKR
jgi:hypothetical protein